MSILTQDECAVFAIVLGHLKRNPEWQGEHEMMDALYDRLTSSRQEGDTVQIGSLRLQRRTISGCERVTVEVEIDGEWIEVIRTNHDNYFDHFVSPSGMRAAFASQPQTGKE